MPKIVGLILFLLTFNFQRIPSEKDRGIGVLFLLQGQATIDTRRADTVFIYKERNFGSMVLDRYSINPKDRFDVLIKGNDEQAQLLEFEYESLGLPILEVQAQWIKVIFGRDNNSGKTLSGWINHKEGITNYHLWRNHLKEHLLFFDSPNQISFFDKINGANIAFTLAPSKFLTYDYIMRPLLTDGVWMKVEVTTPSDYCESPNVREIKIFWIKYLDQRGRPMVWYFTRGC